MEGKTGGANKEAAEEQERKIFMNTNEIVFNYVCECNACASSATSSVSNGVGARAMTGPGLGAGAGAGPGAGTAQRSNVSVAHDTKPTRAPVVRPKLVDEIMRKFLSALINISHYLRSEKAQLSPAEVSAITAKLGKLLMGSNSRAAKPPPPPPPPSPPQSQNARRSYSRELQNAAHPPTSTSKPTPTPTRVQAQPGSTERAPFYFKETRASKKRRIANTLKKNEMDEKERECLKLPEWNSSPCLSSSQGRHSNPPTHNLSAFSHINSVESEMRNSNFEGCLKETTSLKGAEIPLRSSCDSLLSQSTSQYYYLVHVDSFSKHLDCHGTESLLARFKETIASKKRRALNAINKQRLDEEELRRLRQGCPAWDSSTRLEDSVVYSLSSHHSKFSQPIETKRTNSKGQHLSNEHFSTPCRQPASATQFSEQHTYQTPYSAKRAKSFGRRHRFPKGRGCAAKVSEIVNSQNDINPDDCKAACGGLLTGFYKTARLPKSIGAMRGDCRRSSHKDRSPSGKAAFGQDCGREKESTMEAENLEHMLMRHFADAEYSEPHSSEDNCATEVKDECRHKTRRRSSFDSLPRRLSKMSVTDLPQKMFPVTCQLLNKTHDSPSFTKPTADIRGGDPNLGGSAQQFPRSRRSRYIGCCTHKKSRKGGKNPNFTQSLSKGSGSLPQSSSQPVANDNLDKNLVTSKGTWSSKPSPDGVKLNSVHRGTSNVVTDEDWWSSTSSGSGYETSFDIED